MRDRKADRVEGGDQPQFKESTTLISGVLGERGGDEGPRRGVHEVVEVPGELEERRQLLGGGRIDRAAHRACG
jgi:hypothetical protein